MSDGNVSERRREEDQWGGDDGFVKKSLPDMRDGASDSAGKAAEHLFARRLLLRKTSTEHTIVKDGELAMSTGEEANDTSKKKEAQPSPLSQSQQAQQQQQQQTPSAAPMRGHADFTHIGSSASISQLQAKLASASQGQLRMSLGDSRSSIAGSGITTKLGPFTNDGTSPVSLQERLQWLKDKMDSDVTTKPWVGTDRISYPHRTGRNNSISATGHASGQIPPPRSSSTRASMFSESPLSATRQHHYRGASEVSSDLATVFPPQSPHTPTPTTTTMDTIVPPTVGEEAEASESITASADGLHLRMEFIRSNLSFRNNTTGSHEALPSLRFSPLTIKWPVFDASLLGASPTSMTSSNTRSSPNSLASSNSYIPATSATTTTSIATGTTLNSSPSGATTAAAAGAQAIKPLPNANVHVRTTGTTPVFLYMEDDTCSMFTVPPNTTVNEVRMEALQKLGFMEIVESYRVFWMDTGAGGEPIETRLDPNTAVDYLTPPAPATIKLRMRRKSAIKWSIPVVVDERVFRTRWVVVEAAMSVGDVVRILCTVEGKEDELEEWCLCCEDSTSVKMYAPTDTPFVPWSRAERYLFRSLQQHQSRRSKLVGLLGLPPTTDMSALATQVSNAAQDEKRRLEALKSHKLSYILGIDKKVNAADGVGADGEREMPGSRLKFVRRVEADRESSDEDSDESMQAERPRSKSLVQGIGTRPNSGGGERKRSMQFLGKKLGSQDTFRHSVALSSSYRGTVHEEDAEQDKRKEKLADFFGVAKQKHFNQLHGIIKGQKPAGKSEKNAASDPSNPTSDSSHYVVRIYFGNLTYSGVRLPMAATATHAKGLLLTKLMINNSGEQFGLFVHSHDGAEREMTADERLYDIMLRWSPNDYFLFKQRPVKNLLRHKRFNSVQSMDSLLSIDEAPTARRVAKLAGFFGIDATRASGAASTPLDRQTPATEADDLHRIFTMLAASGNGGSSRTLPMKSSSSLALKSSGARPIALPTTLYKEGWIHSYQGTGKKMWVCNWASLDNGYLFLRPNLKDEAITVEDVTVKPPMSVESCNVKVMDPSVYKRPHTFAVTVKNWTPTDPDGRVVLSALTEAEAADWINCIKIAGRVNTTVAAKDEKPLPSGPVEDVSGKLVAAPEQADQEKLSMDDFELHRVIGRGKFAKVLLCSRRSTQKVYAIKVLTKQPTNVDPRDPSSDQTSESRILRSIHHPFIVGLHYAFQSAERLYLVMEYINGGELYFHVSHYGRFSEERVRFYAAELLLGLQCLHGKGIIYRDLKLENILLSKDGHVKITDFGLSKQEEEGGNGPQTEDEDSETISVVGTLEYLAPEVLYGHPHTAAADIWALGVVTFEMLCGFHPFYSDDRQEIQDNILHAAIEYPSYVSSDARNFISRLLNRDPQRRMMGADIQKHPFFKSIDWQKLFNMELEVPFKPELTDDYDVSFFEDEFTDEMPALTPMGSSDLLSHTRVENFSYRGPI
ncbi:hypothetical protein PhCBS80983_g04815 [Powellomyces hirtus]|uniref:Non-specific serine/threonine protein kinase n=1 Tax=Powellomyces hirtus TaxID=109895 RepID=A0A507DYP7_9FUNG|nr:hypothetical protein PhCBS80983_g04815 [Powellomyces hirtus]